MYHVYATIEAGQSLSTIEQSLKANRYLVGQKPATLEEAGELIKQASADYPEAQFIVKAAN